MTLAPIVLFTYNRLWHTKQTVEALQKNALANESELFVYSDGAKNDAASLHVRNIREYLQTIEGFKKVTVIEREKNWGLANSIIDGVTNIVNQYGKIIVLEDDLVTSPCFLTYMNEALTLYENEPKVISIHGYIYPVADLPDTFFLKGADCWGWATWKRGWDAFEANGQKLLDEVSKRKLQKEADFDGAYAYTQMLKDQIQGKNNSWAIRWYFSALLQDALTLYPGKSYVQNIGLDGQGTHCSATTVYDVALNFDVALNNVAIREDKVAKAKIRGYFLQSKRNIFEKIITKIVGYLRHANMG
ncbi:glycosyltransferase [Sulfurospirillum sp. hDNRA2]|uniref:glycosyltransferase n=1 Tax=Sulfurospirillum sp. hDNRA2 TaxID=3237298 RepID=UPI0020B739CF|nr:glycosyltransferase [Sulfurospirillum sp. DNRA8]MCP3653172.1 glycosyltransferase [Sulfurospirillum sp. DNRA8]MCR1812023.1 glycosyltransferase [Sulfurospirillum sp. DNRA8]